MRFGVMAIATVLAGVIGAGCGGTDAPGEVPSDRLCDAETRADTFAAGLERTSDGSGFSVRLMDNRVEGQPGPPDRGMNILIVEVRDGAGAPVPDAELRLRPWMPDHGHGTTPLIHTATPEGDDFEVGPFNLHMGGYWEFGFTIESAGTTDQVQFGFCVEG